MCKPMKSLFFNIKSIVCFTLIYSLSSVGPTIAEDNLESKRPNILLIVADDLGWSDIGSFGGEIATPNLDKLASSGLRLTNFHVAPTCSPTRSMLLTGTDSHLAGLGNMQEETGPNQRGKQGYEGYLNNRVVTAATLLKDSGYRTMMSGKWHLGSTIELGPESRGFQDVFVLPVGAANHFQQIRAVGTDPNIVDKAPYRENGISVDLPENFYSSEFFTDKLIEYIEINKNSKEPKPFFAFASYTAPHWPLQAPDKFIKKYEGIYEKGYEETRNNRIKKIKELEILNFPTEPITSELWPRWESLSEEIKTKEVKRMQVYAGMVEALDHHIGRLIKKLSDIGELSNTIVIFMSDNGAEGNDPQIILNNEEWIPANFDNSIQNMGRGNSFIGYGPRWAEVSSTPFRIFKGFTTDGGIRSPAIISYPKFDHQSKISNAFSSVMDITPTLLEIAGIGHPGESYNGRTISPMKGESLLPFLKAKQQDVHNQDYAMGWELFNRKALKHGDWKLVWNEKPYGKDGWELYNLSNDPFESNDISEIHDTKLKEMIKYWDQYVQENGVIIDTDLNLEYSSENFHYTY